MEPQFWHDRWQLNEIGFHQNQIHPWLSEYWPQVFSELGRVFVPLCGKSLDILWLRQQGYSVLGVELSPIAIRDFFKEHELTAKTYVTGGFQSYGSDGIRIVCGDFFELRPGYLTDIQAVYDRAALIALPMELQARYAEHLLRLLPQRPPMLLITFEYDPAEMRGPPFSTPEAKVRELFGHAYQIDILQEQELLDENLGLKRRGLTKLTEKVYRLQPF